MLQIHQITLYYFVPWNLGYNISTCIKSDYLWNYYYAKIMNAYSNLQYVKGFTRSIHSKLPSKCMATKPLFLNKEGIVTDILKRKI